MTQSTSPKRILVTGGSGYVGRAFIARMLREGRDVAALGRSQNDLPSGAAFIAADLAEPGSLRAALRRLAQDRPFDSIIHLAVSRRHREFPGAALDLFHVNSAAAAELLDFARATSAGSAVFGSTGTVYSSTSSTEDDVDGGDAETVFRKPASYFAASKLFADAMAELYRPYLPVAVLRLYAPYGPGLTGRMLNDLIARVREGRPLSLPARGPGLGFAAVYVDDAVDVLTQAMDQRWSETVNVAAPECWTIASAGELIGRLLGRDPSFERSAAGFAPWIVPCLTRLHALRPGAAYVGLEEGLRRMIAAGG